MATSQTFRIEIPIETIDETNPGIVQDLNKNLLDLYNTVQRSKGAGNTAFDGMDKSASKADKSVDKFSKSMEKTEKQLASMSQSKHEVLLELRDNATKALKEAWGFLKGFAGKTWQVAVGLKDRITAPLKSAFSLVTKLIGAAGVASTVLGGLSLKNAFGEYSEQQRMDAQLKVSALNMGIGQAGIEAINAQANVIERKTMYTGTAMTGAAAELATYFSDAQAITRMMSVVTDYAAGMSGGVELSTEQIVDYTTNLAKMTTGAYDAMTKKGFEVTKAQKKILETGTDMQKVAAIESIIRENWDGMAEAFANTPTGMLTRVKNEWDNISESIGGKVSPRVLDFFTILHDRMPRIGGLVEKGADALMGLLDRGMPLFDQFLDGTLNKMETFGQSVSDLFGDADFQDANLFGKLSIAWDKLVAEPFDEWWGSSGRSEVTRMGQSIGEELGAGLQGFIMSGLSLITGQDYGMDTLNVSPMMEAGVTAGKAFVDGFTQQFNAGKIGKAAKDALGVIAQDALKILPGQNASGTSWLSALLIGGGAAKVSGFFSGLTPVVKSSVSAVGSLGKVFAAVSGLSLSTVTGIGIAIAAVGVGILLYQHQMEQQHQYMLDMGDRMDAAGAKAQKVYDETSKIDDLINKRRELKVNLELANSLTAEDLDNLRQELDGVDKKIADINERKGQLAKEFGFGSVAAADAFMESLNGIDTLLAQMAADKKALENDFKLGKINQEEYNAAVKQIDENVATLNAKREELVKPFEMGGFDLTAFTEGYTGLQNNLDTLVAKKTELEEMIKLGEMDETAKQGYLDQIKAIEEQLMGLSGGLISQYDLENDKMEEKISLLQQQLELQRQIANAELKNQVYAEKQHVPETLARIKELQDNRDKAEGEVHASDVGVEKLTKLNNEYKKAQEDYRDMVLKENAGDITTAQLMAYENDTYFPQLAKVESGLQEVNQEIPKEWFTGGINYSHIGQDQLRAWVDPYTGDYRQNMAPSLDQDVQGIQQKQSEWRSNMSGYDAEIAQLWGNLGKLYGADVLTAQNDHLNGMNLEEAARNYASLTADQHAGFSDAVNALTQINQDKAYSELPPEMMLDPARLYELIAESWKNRSEADNGDAALDGMNKSDIGIAIANLQATTTRDKHNDTQFTQDLKSNEEAYKNLQKYDELKAAGKDTSELEKYFTDRYGDEFGIDFKNSSNPSQVAEREILNERQGIVQGFGDQIQQGYGAVQQIQDDYTGLQGRNDELKEQQANLVAAKEAMQQYQDVSNLDKGQQAEALKEVNQALKDADLSPLKDLSGIGEAQTAVQEQLNANDSTIEANKAEMESLMQQNQEAITSLQAALSTYKFNMERDMADALKIPPVDTASIDTAKKALEELKTGLGAMPSPNVDVKVSDNGEVSSIKSAIDSLPTSKEIAINIKTSGSVPSVSGGSTPAAKNADGGIYGSKAFLSLVAEDGPEAIIPLGAKRRDRGLALWREAGRHLGVSEMADGGVFAASFPRGMSLYDEPDGSDGHSYQPISAPEQRIVIEGMKNEFRIEITGNVPTEKADELRSVAGEIADEAAARFAEKLEDIFSNQPIDK